MAEPSDLDRASVRRQFDRRAAAPDPADWLHREIERRMLERLEWVRLAPARVLDVGCGLGEGVRRLRGRFPAAQTIGVELSPRRAAAAAALDRPGPGRWARALARRLTGRGEASPAPPLGRYVAADAHALPLATDSIDLVWSNLAFHWFDDVPAAIAEWYRVLRPGGLLTFSAFGVETLAGLRAVGLRLPALPDLHDVGDALLGAGFAEPVMDGERLTVTWTDPLALLADLRALGGDARRSRPRGLASRTRRDRALAEACARLRGDDPAAPMSVVFELVYGHAWIGPRKPLPGGWRPVAFQASRPPGRGR
jgi:malonyl-CoA O-methyltransferase